MLWFGQNTGKYIASALKLASCPPKTAIFCDNAKRAHYQAYLCKHAVDQDIPNLVLDPPEYFARVDTNNITRLNEPTSLT